MPRGGQGSNLSINVGSPGVSKNLLQMLSSNLSINVGSSSVWVGTPDVIRSSGANVSSSDAYMNYNSSAKFNFTGK